MNLQHLCNEIYGKQISASMGMGKGYHSKYSPMTWLNAENTEN